MHSLPASIFHDQERLGQLAMSFRGTREPGARQAIADAYSQTVTRLIASGNWHEMPAPEELLADQWMPKAFFDYWLREQPQ